MLARVEVNGALGIPRRVIAALEARPEENGSDATLPCLFVPINTRGLYMLRRVPHAVLFLFALCRVASADEKSEIETRIRDLIDRNGAVICHFAHPHARDKKGESGKIEVLADGLKVTVHLYFSGSFNRFNKYSSTLTGFFHSDGTFSKFSTSSEHSGARPFVDDATPRALDELRALLRATEPVKSRRRLLELVDASDARQLCELYLQLHGATKGAAPKDAAPKDAAVVPSNRPGGAR